MPAQELQIQHMELKLKLPMEAEVDPYSKH